MKKSQKAKEQELGCKFISINLDKEKFNIFVATNEIFRYIKQMFNDNVLLDKKIIRKPSGLTVMTVCAKIRRVQNLCVLCLIK